MPVLAQLARDQEAVLAGQAGDRAAPGPARRAHQLHQRAAASSLGDAGSPGFAGSGPAARDVDLVEHRKVGRMGLVMSGGNGWATLDTSLVCVNPSPVSSGTRLDASAACVLRALRAPGRASRHGRRSRPLAHHRGRARRAGGLAQHTRAVAVAPARAASRRCCAPRRPRCSGASACAGTGSLIILAGLRPGEQGRVDGAVRRWAGDAAIRRDPVQAFAADPAIGIAPFAGRFIVWELGQFGRAGPVRAGRARPWPSDALGRAAPAAVAALRRWLDPAAGRAHRLRRRDQRGHFREHRRCAAARCSQPVFGPARLRVRLPAAAAGAGGGAQRAIAHGAGRLPERGAAPKPA